jgi:hypothetical protein
MHRNTYLDHIFKELNEHFRVVQEQVNEIFRARLVSGESATV